MNLQEAAITITAIRKSLLKHLTFSAREKLEALEENAMRAHRTKIKKINKKGDT